MSLFRALLVFAPFFVAVSACGDDGNGAPRPPCPDVPTIHAPICGSSCTAACGCKDCADGEIRKIDDATYVCQNHCYVFSSGGSDGGGGSAGTTNEDSGPDCEATACDGPAICGQCTNVCGCCDPCEEGMQTTIDGGIYQCTGGCWQQL